MSEAKEATKEFLDRHGVCCVGFGEVPGDLELLEIDKRLPRVVVFGFRISPSVLATVKDRPTLLYKHHYKTVNWLLDQTAYHLACFLEIKGSQAVAIPASQLVDWAKHQGHISHKVLARAAGLGWIGRSGLLIHPHYGAQVRYCSVLTDLGFEPDPENKENCRDCRKCISVCPARAISEDGIDLKRCLGKLEEFAGIRGIGQHICGVCVKVCDGRG
jgi:epoxyqueuosine reductase